MLKSNMRIFAFISLAVLSLIVPFYIFVIATIGYVLFFRGYEIIILGIVIDSFFGTGDIYLSLYYTSATLAVVILVNLMKPHLSLYD